MSTFFNYAIKDEYARIAERGNSLGEVSSLIDRDSFRPLLLDLYTNTEGKGGRPNYDVVFMIKLLLLQQWYGLSDPQLEREAYDRLSFRHFLGYPTSIPDHSTIWLFRERLIATGKETVIWEELQRQIDQKGLTIRRGVIQDASFITSDPGHARADTPEEIKHRRGEAATVPGQERVQNRISDTRYTLSWTRIINSSEGLKPPPPPSMNDSRIDLSEKGETVYRDKGYFNVKPRASMDKTMHRAVRGHPLSIKEKRRNKAITRTRTLVERPFAVIKTVFHAGYVRVTTCARVHVKCLFSCFSFNVKQLLTIKRQTA